MNKYLTGFDNSVTPHGFENSFLRGLSASDMHGVLLRTGRIVKYWEPTEQRTEPEYDVAVDDYSAHGVSNRFVMYRCRMSCGFGSAADFVRWTPRVSESSAVAKLGSESRVLVLCVNGRMATGSAVIVGALPHHDNQFDRNKGHHYAWQFNGLKTEVDKAGQYRLIFNGATKADGTIEDSADPNASGATFQITKDGSIKLFTKDESQFIDFNHSQKTVSLTSDKEMKLTSRSALIKTDSTGVHLGSATDDMVKGTTYRAQEAVMNNTIANAMQVLSATLTPLMPAITAAAADPGLMAVSAAAASGMAAAGAAIAAIQAAAAAMSAAVSGFEKQSAAYLSTKNKLD